MSDTLSLAEIAPAAMEERVIEGADELLTAIRAIHEAMRDEVIAACEAESAESLSEVVAHEGGDSVFAIDRVAERVLLERFAALAENRAIELVAEGLGATGSVVLGRGEPELTVIVDPIDGTRGLMYQKRPAWILTGVAPRRAGTVLTLADIDVAVQTEIPLVKQHLCDTLWAVRGGGARGERYDRITRARRTLSPTPSSATTIAHGFGGLARFFPGALALLGAIGDAVVEQVLGRSQPGRAHAFEDQYISTGGQLYELCMGHDRWIADLRPLVEPLLRAEGRALSLCCHPYDLCTELVAREAGVIVRSPDGLALAAPLDVFTDVSWVGYANAHIAAQVTPALLDALRARGIAYSQDA